MAPIWLDVLDDAVRLCSRHGRTDLAQRLQQKRAQLLDPRLRVLVIGDPKQGKSQLINALINAPVCPVGDGLTTAIRTVVHHADAPAAALVHSQAGQPAASLQSTGNGEAAARRSSAVGAPPGSPGRTPVPVAELATRISTKHIQLSGGGSVHAEIGVPRELLASGLVLVDTPGIDGDEQTDGSPIASLTRADVVVMVTDATRELSVPEVDLLLRVAREHPQVVVALTKIDIVPHWRLVADRNRQHLATAGIPAALIPVSATLRLQAAKVNDKAINAESGFPELIARLLRLQRAKGTMVAPTSAGLAVSNVIRQLAAPLRASLATETTSEPLAKLHEAQQALDDLRRRTTRWQNTLSDRMADLTSDLEYDLRDRTRQIMREVDDAFHTADPLRTWPSFQSWLESSLTEAAEANFVWLVQRCDWVVDRVADHFGHYQPEAPPEWRIELPATLRDRTTAIEEPNIERFTIPQKVFTGLRGSYLGVLMFGLATTFVAGLPLLNPISLGAGALFAGKSIWDESKSLLRRRQSVAKTASQRHVDDFFLQLNKESKDTVRRVQRLLRDHYTTVTEQVNDGIVHSLRTAKQAAEADAAERDQHQRDLRLRMKQLAALLERAQALTGGARSAPAGAGSESGT